MDGTVTVRAVLLTALVAVGLVTAYLLGSGGGPVAAPARAASTADESPQDPAIRMTGRGEATAVPDQLTFALTVTAERDDLEAALADSSATMRRVLSALGEYGVGKEDVRTTGLTMNPEYDYPSSGPPVLRGYRVTQDARVEVGELGQGGRAISAAVESGGNGVRVHAIRLGLGDPEAYLEDAREDAVADATAKAEQYAAATGRELGEVLSVREVSAPARVVEPAWEMSRDLALSAAKATVPIRAGTSDVSVRVQVTWSFR